MFNLKLTKSRRVFIRAGASTGCLIFPVLVSVIVFNLPMSLWIRFAISITLLIIFFLIINQAVSEIICNKYRLVVVTPFSVNIHSISSIKHICYQYSQLNYFFSLPLN